MILFLNLNPFLILLNSMENTKHLINLLVNNYLKLVVEINKNTIKI